ncbi:hypothetical protein BZA77DRAFT_360145 [Pyronema omphalodes]|nr:hypothetical protein BZA77DRAFT_360145 [Pyronema omphalodes]
MAAAEAKLLSNSRLAPAQTRGVRWVQQNRYNFKQCEQQAASADSAEQYGSIARYFLTATGPYPQLPPGFQFLHPHNNNPPYVLQQGTSWEQRVNCLLHLLRRRAHRVLAMEAEAGRNQTVAEDSMFVAIEIGRGSRFGRHLREFMDNWCQLCILRPQDMRGKSVRAALLFSDEGIIVAVREYMNAASLKVTPKGICNVVCRVMGSRNAANVMGLDFVLNDDSENGNSITHKIKTDGRVYATEIIKSGSAPSDEGWWNSQRMISKVATRMNSLPGGQQPLMRDTTFVHPSSCILQTQHMVSQPGDDVPVHQVGKAKGIKQVLQERGLWDEGLRSRCPSLAKKQPAETDEQHAARALAFQRCIKGHFCCAFRIMESQPDFVQEKSLIEIQIVKRGHECLFYPKFHCELNDIEFHWGAVKRYTRENCDYTFTGLKRTVCQGLDSASSMTIRRFANKSRPRFHSYASGLDGRQQQFVERAEG